MAVKVAINGFGRIGRLAFRQIDVYKRQLTITIDGKTYTAHAGDVLFVPSNSKVVWGSPDRARAVSYTHLDVYKRQRK